MVMNAIKLLGSIGTASDAFAYAHERFSIDVFECQCGFHIGLDSTFLDQVGCINIPCPSCHENIFVPAYDESGLSVGSKS
jgi:hypothetical protein